MSSRFLAWFFIAAISAPSYSAPEVIHSLQRQYQQQGAQSFSAERGKALWQQEVADKDGVKRACTTCHGMDPAQPGQHVKTKKTIKPMASSVNPARFTDEKKIGQWFTRNCKWTWGRPCTAQEKGDILDYMLTL